MESSGRTLLKGWSAMAVYRSRASIETKDAMEMLGKSGIDFFKGFPDEAHMMICMLQEASI